MVATSHPLAAMSGIKMLMNGGNAVDAAVAAAATLNVVEPMSTGIGGDLFALIWNAKEKSIKALNASGRASGSASIQQLHKLGYSSIPPESVYGVTIPGTVSGWDTLCKTLGTMQLSELLKPAIEYCSNGYAVSPIVSRDWNYCLPKLNQYPSGQEFLLKGKAPLPGQIIRLPTLANSLSLIAEGGSEAFYRGPIASAISNHVQSLGGWLTTDDFASHHITWDDPISTDYRGLTCWECPPNSQGLNALMALNIAEGFDLTNSGLQTIKTFHRLIESMRLAFYDGLHYISDPHKTRVPVKTMLSKGRASLRRSLISETAAMTGLSHDLTLADSDTVYISVVDKDGNACSLINSLFQGFGSGIVVPETGIILQNRGSSFSLDPDHPNSLEPNKRPFHTIIPGMVTKGDQLWLTYGVMGGFHQAQGHLQVLVNMIDFGQDPQTALDTRRFNVNLNDSVTLEQDIPLNVINGLKRMGHNVTDNSGGSGVFYGGGQIIQRDPTTGVLTAGSEPRKDGCAIGW
jgi:gamma-glutamyltranspeptidase/glutathione hydrolase